MTPETGACIVSLPASMERIASLLRKLTQGQKADINDLAELRIARDTIAAVKSMAMTPVVFEKEGALTQKETER